MSSPRSESDASGSILAPLKAFLLQLWYAISGETPPEPEPAALPPIEPPRRLSIHGLREASADVLLTLRAEAPEGLIPRAFMVAPSGLAEAAAGKKGVEVWRIETDAAER